MRTIFLVIFLFCLTTLGFAQTVGDTFIVEGIEYEVTLVGTPNMVSIIDYKGENKDVMIPATVNDTTSGFSYSVTSIGDAAFYENGLTSVIIPESIISMGTGAFSRNSLTSVIIPESITSIENAVFYRNDLISLIIPESITSIGSAAFSYNDLTSIIIPASVTTIGDEAFKSNSLTTITIPETVTSIGTAAFETNWGLREVIAESETPITINNVFSDSYGIAYSVTLTVPIGKEQDYIDAGWTGFGSVNDNDFYFIIDDVIYEVVDANTVNVLQYTTLYTSVNMPVSVTANSGASYTVTTIGARAFYDGSLSSISIPETIISIGDSAFESSDIESIIIPASVTSIGESAFAGNLNYLTEVISESTTPATLLEGTFDDNSLIDLTIPVGTEQAYLDAGWIGFNIIEDASLSIVDTVFNNSINIYPNPIQNLLNVGLSTGQILKKAQVFTVLGKKVLEVTNTSIIDFSTIASGMYMLKIENIAGKVAVRKIIKE